MKNSVPNESQHLVLKIHSFLLLGPSSGNLNHLAFNFFLLCSLSHLCYAFQSHNFPGQEVISDSTLLFPLFNPSANASKQNQNLTTSHHQQCLCCGPSYHMSHLVYCTGFLTGLLTPTLDL